MKNSGHLYVFFFLLIFCAFPVKGQNNSFAPKAYRNQTDFKNDKPLFITSFSYVKNTGRRYYGSYRVKSNGVKIKDKEMKYAIWLISDGDYYYLNAARHGFQPGYIKLPKGKHYYYFKAEPVMSAAQKNDIDESYYNYGLVGSTMTMSQYSKYNKDKKHHVLDLYKGTTDILSVAYIEKLLTEYPILQNEFNNAENKEDIDVLRFYLEAVNEELVK